MEAERFLNYSKILIHLGDKIETGSFFEKILPIMDEKISITDASSSVLIYNLLGHLKEKEGQENHV